MNKVTIPIIGMHCRSCELLISDAISEIPNVSKVIPNFKRKEAEVFSHGEISLAKISEAVEKVGYKVGLESKRKHLFSRDQKIYEDLIVAFVIAAVLYLVAKKLGLFDLNLIPKDGSAENPLVVILIGITAGFSTCMALVGGLILGISAKHAEKHPDATALQKFKPHLYFNLGRIISYFILGGLIGLIGKALQLSNNGLGILTLLVGLFMLVLGLQLTEISPKISSISLSLPTKISKFFGINKHHNKEYSHTNSMVVGAMTFFLPCGFTQAIQVYAMSTGSFWAGAITMGTFALGTAPGLIGIGGLSSLFKGNAGKIFFKFAGVVVIAFALLNISNGYTLVGVGNIGNNTPPPTTTTPPPTVTTPPLQTTSGSVQIIKMSQEFNGYSPNEFTIKKGIPVRWEIDSKTSYSCATSIVIPDLNISRNLQLGANIIEFTPVRSGDLDFMCSMGMFRGVFHVVD